MLVVAALVIGAALPYAELGRKAEL
jgi:hypothetical protein